MVARAVQIALALCVCVAIACDRQSSYEFSVPIDHVMELRAATFEVRDAGGDAPWHVLGALRPGRSRSYTLPFASIEARATPGGYTGDVPLSPRALGELPLGAHVLRS